MDHISGAPTADVGAVWWMQAVLGDGDWLAGWRLMDPACRVDRARRFFTAQRDALNIGAADRDNLADGWSQLIGCEGEVWDCFAETEVMAYRELVNGLPPPTRWAWLRPNEPAGADTEVVTFVPVPSGGEAEQVVRYLMRYVEGEWRVLNTMTTEPPSF